MRFNLGSGPNPVEGWTNVDYAIGARIARVPVVRLLANVTGIFNSDWDSSIVIADLRKRFPWDDGVADAVYSSHTLEHFSKMDGEHFLAESVRILKPGGILRVVVPDFAVYIERYRRDELKADDFIDDLDVAFVSSGGFTRRLAAPYIQFPHRCMYDEESLVRKCENLGIAASRRQPFESDVNGIREVELEKRAVGALIVEGRKMGS